ncbi:retrovirus-related pol polyprotein from transposon TNT 1-94 [Tanacetum coccineum]
MKRIRLSLLMSTQGTPGNSILVNFYDEKGISQIFSSPYTPEQNGVVERKNRTLIEAARTMLSGSVFSKQYWTEDVATACYTQNRSTIVKRHLKTPYEIFRKRIPNINFLHVFRCPVYIHNHKDHLGKFDEKAYDDYLLRYLLVSKSFRVFNTRRQQIEETYHITFNESPEAIKFSKPSVDNINIAETKRYPPDEYLHPYEPSQRYQTNSNDVSFIEPHECPEPVVIETEVLYEQNGHLDQNDEILNDDHSEHSNHTNDEQIIDNLPNTKDIQISEHLSSPNFLSKEEPKKVSEALKHPRWVDAMQDELNQFSRNKVWTLVPAPYGKTIIGSEWQEDIDYDETFAPVARLEAIRNFLAFATYMNFIVYQMDIKSAFLNGKLKEEVYVKQPPGFESNEFPNHVYKLDKALYGLRQAPRAWYETLSTFLTKHKFVRGKIDNTLFVYKTQTDVILVEIYVDDIIFGSSSTKLCKQFAKPMTQRYEMSMIVKTPMVPPNNLGPNLNGKVVNETQYRGMIGSLKDEAPQGSYSQRVSNNPVLHLRTKHIDIRYHFIRDHILKGEIELHFIPTQYQLADIFTKPLDEPTFKRLIVELELTDLKPEVYQMDIKSAFLNGKVKEEVYVKQPPGFESNEFPNHVYKLDKALYGLRQAPRACKDSNGTPNNLGPNLNGKVVKEYSNIGDEAPQERIIKKKTKNEAKTTKPDSEWKSKEKTKSKSKPKPKKSTQVNPKAKSQEK